MTQSLCFRDGCFSLNRFNGDSAAVKYLLTLLLLVFLPTFTCQMLHKSHLNIVLKVRLRRPDFQQLKHEADVDREWTIKATNQSYRGRKCTPTPPFDLPKANTTGRRKVSLAEVQLCDLPSQDCRFLHGWPARSMRGSGPFPDFRDLFLDRTVPASRSPAWWRLWSRWGDTRASRHHSSPRTSPAAHRKGCRCAPPLWGTPAPPPPASRWSCRSCGYTLLQTSTLWGRESVVGVGLNGDLNNLVTATLCHVHRNINPAAICHWCILLSLRS